MHSQQIGNSIYSTSYNGGGNFPLVTSTPHVLGDTSQEVTAQTWAVSAVRKQDSKNPLHLFLCVQGVENHRNILKRVHLVIDNSSSGARTISGTVKKAKIIIDDYSDAFNSIPEEVDTYYKNCVHKTAWVTAEKANEILDIAKRDQQEELYYSLLDSDIKQFSIQIGASDQTRNCASYAEFLLDRAGIKLITSGWLGVFVVHPKVLVPDQPKKPDDKDTSGSCSLL